MKILRNFKKDWVDYLRDNLINHWGYTQKIVNDISDDELPYKYYDALKRHIITKKRSIKYSKSFICPAHLKNNLAELVLKIENGNDINPHLSKRIEDLEAEDEMLNDWNIHHLHLGAFTNGKFSERTSELLFAFIDDKTFHMIGIYKHNNWADHSIISIIDANWPELIECFHMKDAIDISHNPNSTERIFLRKNKINSAIKLDNGKIFSPIGLGTTTAKNNVSVSSSMYVINQVNLLTDIDEWVEKKEIKKILINKKFDVDKDIYATLIIIQDNYSIKFKQLNDDESQKITLSIDLKFN